MTYSLLVSLHVLGAILMAGTTFTNGLLRMHVDRTDDIKLVAYVSRAIVFLDFALMLPGMVLLSVTGVAFGVVAGMPLFSGWTGWGTGLMAGLWVLFVVGVAMEWRLLQIADAALPSGAVPAEYRRLDHLALPVGFAATALILVALYVMVFREPA